VRTFCLTPLTRGAASQRRVVIQGFDLPARTLLIAGLAFLPAVVVTLIAWVIVGEVGLLAIPLVEGLAFWLIEARTRSGLKLRTYQALADKRKAKREVGKFFVAGRELDPLGEEWVAVRSGSVPVRPLFRSQA
jgi:hypothetical protein